MFDAITFEKRGVPAAVICTEPFVPTARTMARIQGLPDYRYVLLPHPVGSLTPEQVMERARRALPGVIEVLLGR